MRALEGTAGDSGDGARQPIVLGSGWLGSAAARSMGVRAVPRRSSSVTISVGAPVLVASGRSELPATTGVAEALATELRHLRSTLDACADAGAARVIVLGSSDVAGLTGIIDGQSPQAPRTPYAAIKAAIEDECLLRRSLGQNIVVVRLAPVHGPGKPRTVTLCKVARWPIVALPNGGEHSVGFVLLDDAIAAIAWLLENDAAAPVVSVGAGAVPLRELLRALASAQGSSMTIARLPRVPRFVLTEGVRYPDRVEWLLRLALPRAIAMDVPVPISPLAMAAKRLLDPC